MHDAPDNDIYGDSDDDFGNDYYGDDDNHNEGNEGSDRNNSPQ
jgi:hypothetical protein